VWSLGCILYELCALRPPFNADSHVELVKKVTSGHLQRIPSGYSDDLFALISALLQVNVSAFLAVVVVVAAVVVVPAVVAAAAAAAAVVIG